MRENALLGSHLLDDKALPFDVRLDELVRQIGPSFTVLAIQWKESRLLGLFVKGLDEKLGRRGHIGGGIVREEGGDGSCQQEDECERFLHEFEDWLNEVGRA